MTWFQLLLGWFQHMCWLPQGETCLESRVNQLQCAQGCFPDPNRLRLSRASGSLLLCILTIILFIPHPDSVRGSAEGREQLFGVGKRQPYGMGPTSWSEPPLRPMLTLQLTKHMTSFGYFYCIAVLFPTSEAFLELWKSPFLCRWGIPAWWQMKTSPKVWETSNLMLG